MNTLADSKRASEKAVIKEKVLKKPLENQKKNGKQKERFEKGCQTINFSIFLFSDSF